MSDKALLQYQDKTFEFPVIQGSENELAIDIKTLRAQKWHDYN
jgi:citrate synthase